MKKQLPGYYRPTQEEFDSLWENGLIVFDTNVLLDLYRISKKASDELLQTIKQYSRQIWIPNQAESEFQQKRNDVIIEQKEGYADLISYFSRSEGEISTRLQEYSRHPYIEIKKFQEPIQKTLFSVVSDLKKLEENHPDLIFDDPILDELNRLFKGKIGDKYPEARLQEIFIEGKKRFELKIPPGFKDQDKVKNGDNEQFGDLVLWYQIIDKAKSSKKPIILVTSEKKKDWWRKIKGQTIGPKPELIEEMQEKANVQFYMYSSDQFVRFAQERLKQTVNQDTVNELHEIRSTDEIAEVMRDEGVRIEADRDSFVIGRSVEFFGYSYTNENFVRLFLFGPGQFSEGIEIATPSVTDSNVWRYLWSPGYSIQAGIYSFVVYDPQKRISDEVTVKAEKGAIAIVVSGDQSFYVGEKIKISGTSTASSSVYLAIRGVNVSPDLRKLDNLSIISKNIDEYSFVKVDIRSDYTWSYIWDTSVIGSSLREGIYTIYAIEGPFSSDSLEGKAFGTVSIIIKKPFVCCTVSQSTIAQGDRIFIIGTAEGVPRQKIQIWIFSNSFFSHEIIHTNSDSSFMYQLSPAQTKQLLPENYFVLVQHPMMNNTFDVYVDTLNKSVLSNSPNATTPLFSIEGTGGLHGVDAAMAVVNAINDPGIDDTYTKCMFSVELPMIHINPIEKKHVGELFTITALTNLAVDSEILIEVYSLSFDPNKKIQVGEFSGATGVIKVARGESGYNKFSFDVDTSTFVPDTYTIKVSKMDSDLTTSAIFIIKSPSIFSFMKNAFFSIFRK